MISSRKPEQLAAAAEEIGALGGPGSVAVFAANGGRRRRRPSVRAGDDRALRRTRHAGQQRGTNPYFGATLDVDPARYDKTFEVNLRGPLFWTKHAWELAFVDKPGVVINIASVGGLRAEFGLGVYNLTKAALIHLTRQLANELGPTRVVGVAPGLVQTDFAAVLVENFGEQHRRAPADRAGWASPQDMANLATFLASDAGRLDHRRDLRDRRRRRA